jgi:chromosome segregation ATPase
MNIETYKQIIDEADNSIMTGSDVTPDYVRLLSTLRLAVDEASTRCKLQDWRIKKMHDLIESLKQQNADLRAEVASKENVVVNIKREHRAEINGVRRQAGIWKAKAKRLEGVIAAE